MIPVRDPSQCFPSLCDLLSNLFNIPFGDDLNKRMTSAFETYTTPVYKALSGFEGDD